MVMDSSESSITDNLLQQKDKTIEKSSLEKTIFRFTCFQIIIVDLQLAFAIPELTSGTFFLFSLVSFILVPIFIISIFVEIITIVVIKTTHKASDTKTQDLPFANIQYSVSNKDIDVSSQKHQTKRLKSSTKALIVLFSMIGITVLLVISNVFVHRYYAISDAFSREEKTLNDSPYHAEIIKKDPINGVMTVQLDNNIVFDYICEVNLVSINTGYGPFCSRHFSDGSYNIGE